MQKFQAIFVMKENVIKVFEYEFYFPQDSEKVEEHKVLLVNYKVVLPKKPLNLNTKFEFKTNYSDKNVAIGTCLEIWYENALKFEPRINFPDEN